MYARLPSLTPLCLISLSSVLCADSITLVNPSGEINPGGSPSFVAGAAVPGWEGSGQVINDRTDFGNGGWRISFEDSSQIYQISTHTIELGASYSLRFDSSVFSSNTPPIVFTPNLTLVGPGNNNGDFNDDTSSVDSRSFADTPSWINLGTGGQPQEATRTTLHLDNTRNAVVSDRGNKIFAVDTGHTLATGEVFRASYQWRDASSWADAADRIAVSLFVTSDNTITGTRTILQTLTSSLSNVDSSYQAQASVFLPAPATANGKKLFASIHGVNGNANNSGFARLDNFLLERGTTNTPLTPRQVIADLYVENGGTREVIASRSYHFKSSTIGNWHHYHLAVPAGSLDSHVGKTLGVQFRSSPTTNNNYQSVDNVRLDFWPANAADGAFNNNWNVGNRPWIGAGFWANRLQDWRVSQNRAECTLGSRDRRTLHRVGTSIRGNGGSFTMDVTTGINTGAASDTSRSGFLIGAGPSLDWRGALLVHDGLGRDFGILCALRGDGAVVIEDLGSGVITPLATGAVPASLPSATKLNLTGTYNNTTGEYTLTLTARDGGNAVISTATANVPSDRVLGSHGLLSHRGTGSTAYWYDDYSGSGDALHPEEERHLAILGAMYTLSRGTMKLVAQLSPVDPATTAPVSLETWNGSSWNQIASSAIDNTDNLSSYTASFRIENWDDTKDTNFRLGVTVDGQTHYWTGRVRRDPIDQTNVTLGVTTCQRISDGNVQGDGFNWSPVRVWQPHGQLFHHISKQQPDMLLALGDQIYEGQPTPEDSSASYIRQHDYLYKWYLWVLQARELTRDMPTICMTDDHDIFQGNLWGEGGISTGNQNTGGYEEPASWVKMVERTQTLHLPDTDPYNATQPAPPIAQGIPTYFTGMVYGEIGFAILEDRKFKTGKSNPPSDPNQQFLLGDRQKSFLRAWADDWKGQSLKCVVSQSPLGNLHTHSSGGYNFGLNDRDAHGWPVHRRNEAWALLRKTRMFQIAGDQHVATVAHHGIDGPADAGYSFTAPAVANFFPRVWDPVHNSAGRTSTVSPYKGDFYFDGNGTLPSGQPNLTAEYPAHMRVLASGNPLEYHNQTRGINPPNLHDRGAGYGIVRINKSTRRITFEAWPIHADPEFPQTGSQFPDWPISISQTDNDGRTPTGYLPVIDTQWRKDSVVSVYDETSGELIYSYRLRGNLFRPPVYNNATTYRTELSHGDDPASETLTNQTPNNYGAAVIHRFSAIHATIVGGASSTLQWNVENPSTLSIDNGLGDISTLTVHGIGQIEVSPTVDTTYTLTLNGSITAQTTVRVYPAHGTWLDNHFTPAEQANPAISGNDQDPDEDGLDNWTEFLFQTDPRSHTDLGLRAYVIEEAGQSYVEFDLPTPVIQSDCAPMVESSLDLSSWNPLPSNTYRETSRTAGNPTTRIKLRVTSPVPDGSTKKFYRASWR
ncbi:MAG: alkaline phosphatase D family protein [Akkermansiaceae bacterium]